MKRQQQLGHVVAITVTTLVVFIAGQFIGTALYLVGASLFGATSNGDSVPSFGDAILDQFLIVATIEIVTLGLVYFGMLQRRKSALAELKLTSAPSTKSIIYAAKAYGVYYAALVLAYIIIDAIVPVIDTSQVQQLGFDAPSDIGLAYTFVALVVLPPLVEEIIFRGVLFRKLRHVIRFRYAALVTSVLFSVAHLEFLGDNPLNYIAAIDTFLLSLSLVWVYEKTQNLYLPIMMHALKNSIAFYVIYIAV